MKPLEIAGQTFALLTAIERMGKNKRGNYLWRCRCACGREAMATANNLKHKLVKSCGCLSDPANRRKYHPPRYDLFGAKVTLAEISEVSGLSTGTLHYRIMRGATPEQAAFGDWATLLPTLPRIKKIA